MCGAQDRLTMDRVATWSGKVFFFFFMVKKHQSQTLPLATINVFWGKLGKIKKMTKVWKKWGVLKKSQEI